MSETKIDFSKWTAEWWRDIANPVQRTTRAIIERDNEFQATQQGIQSEMTPEAQAAANRVQAEFRRQSDKFHSARRPAISTREDGLSERAARLAAETAAAIRELSGFEDEAGAFLRKTNGPALRRLGDLDLAQTLEQFASKVQQHRQPAVKPVARRIADAVRPVFADLLGRG